MEDITTQKIIEVLSHKYGKVVMQHLRKPLSIVEISKKGIPTASVYRILEKLIAVGLVNEYKEDFSYRPYGNQRPVIRYICYVTKIDIKIDNKSFSNVNTLINIHHSNSAMRTFENGEGE